MPDAIENRTLTSEIHDDLARQLAATDDLLERAYPGEDGRRQPVHTVYVSGDVYTPDLPARWGEQAIAAAEAHGGLEQLCRTVGLSDELAAEVAPRVAKKLAAEPIEDLRLDFEDAYGNRGDEAEDAAVVACAKELAKALADGVAPAFVGTRFKCFEAATRDRGIATFDLFLTTLLNNGGLPDGLVLTFPKVSTVAQVDAMVELAERFEAAAGLEPGRLGFEIQIETPQIILGADGTIGVAQALHAGKGRVTSLHYGTYDYSASMQIAAEYQSMEHPVADQAKALMQLAVAGTGVHMSDGSTNILPLGTPEQQTAAWQLHTRLVLRSLRGGIYQGWDLHPAQLPTRYIANYAFYREGFARAALRLHNYITKTGSEILDEPATARALARYIQRGYACGALDDAEVTEKTGLTPAQVAALARPKSDTDNPASISAS